MFKRTSKALTKADIEEVEAKLGFPFPQGFVRHYLEYNGGRPEGNHYNSEESDIEVGVQVFAPIKYHEDPRLKTVEEKYAFFKEKSEMMADYLPFANDYGGNPICVNVKTGEVSIVWMDLGEVSERCFCYLAEDFDEFVDGLTEESIDD